MVGGGDWSPDFETQSGKEERLDKPAKASRSESSMPRRVLIVFSGPFNRPDGLASELTKLGYEVVEVDTLGEGETHNIRRPASYCRCIKRISRLRRGFLKKSSYLGE